MSKNPKPFRNIHPSEMVIEEMCFCIQNCMEVGSWRLINPKELGILEAVVAGKRSINRKEAKVLHKAFGQSAQYWLNLQKNYDEREAETGGRKMTEQKPTTNAVEILKRRYVGQDTQRKASIKIERCIAAVESLEHQLNELAELVASARDDVSPFRPWQVVGVDPPPEDTRLVEVTILHKDNHRSTRVWGYGSQTAKWYSCDGYAEPVYGCKVLAWCELPEPWQGEVKK